MTIYRGPVFDWRRSGLDWNRPPWESDSPNLVQIAIYMRENFGGGSMGIHYDKQTTSGVVSEHSWGAADDWGTGQSQIDWLRSVGRPAGRVLTRTEHTAAVDWLVAHSAELHIQSIVDIGRSWRADRVDNGAGGWRPYDSGYTGHCHIVTTFDGWDDNTPVAQRLAPITPPPPPKEDDMAKFVKPRGYKDQFLVIPVSADTKARLGDTNAPFVEVDVLDVKAFEQYMGYGKLTKE